MRISSTINISSLRSARGMQSVRPAGMDLLSRLRGPELRGVLDQGLTSAENFAIGIILIRNCQKPEYGLFALGYSMLLMAWGLVAALTTAQMSAALLQDSFGREERQAQYGSLLRSLLLACVLACGCGGLLLAMLHHLDIVAAGDIPFWVAMSLALPGLCLRDFVRRYFFQERSEGLALLMDAVALALTIALLGAMALLHVPHLESVAAGTLAVGSLAVGLWGLHAGGLSTALPGGGARARLSSLWRSGRWNIGASLLSWVPNQAYSYGVTAMLGLSSLATVNAPRVLLTPITLLSTGLSLALVPRFANQRTNLHAVAGTRMAAALLSATTLFVGFYLLALWIGRGAFVPLALGNRYSDVWPCMVAWAIVNVFASVRIYYTTFLLARVGFRQLAAANTVGAAVVLVGTVPMINAFGVLGSVYALAAGELLLGMATLHQCRRVAGAGTQHRSG